MRRVCSWRSAKRLRFTSLYLRAPRGFPRKTDRGTRKTSATEWTSSLTSVDSKMSSSEPHLGGIQNVIFWPLTSAVSRMSSFYLIRLQNLWIKKTTINWMEVQKIETINKGWLLENFFSISIFSIRFLTSMTFWQEFLLFMCTAQWLNSCT